MPRVGRKKGVQSIEIGQQVLQALASGTTATPLGEVARITGMSPSKVHSYLVSYIRAGMVGQDSQTGLYCLGAAALRLGLAAIAQTDAIATARNAIRHLVDETGETAFLSVWGNHGPTVVHRLSVRTATPLELKVGTVLPVLTSATGRVFVAFLPRTTTAPVVQHEQAPLEGITSAGRSVGFDWGIIDRVLQRGLAREAGMLWPGLVSLAAPVFDHEGTASFVVTVLGQMSNFDAKLDGVVASSLLSITQQLSHDLGFTPASVKDAERQLP